MKSKLKFNNLTKSILISLVISTLICVGYFLFFLNTPNINLEDDKLANIGTILEEQKQIPDLDEKINKTLELVKNNPNNPEILHKLGILYENKHLIDMAIKQWEKAAAIAPNNMEYLNDLGRGYYYSCNYSEALKIFKALTEQKKDIKFKINLAFTHYKLGQFNKAIPLFETVLKEKPDYYRALIYLANMYFESGTYQQASEYMDKASKISPDNAYIHYNLGIIYKNINSYDKALEELKKAYDLKKDDPNILIEMAKLLKYNNDLLLAIRILIEVPPINNSSASAKAYDLLGQIYYTQGKFSDSIQAFKRSIDCENYNLNSYYSLGNIFYDSGQIIKAIYYWELAKKINPELKYLNINLAQAYFDNQQYSKALKIWSEKFDCSFKDAYFFYNLSIAYYKTKQYKLAEEFINKAIILDNEEAKFHETLANIYLAQEKKEMAMEEFNTCLTLDPGNIYAYITISKIYFKLGDYVEATGYLTKALEVNPENNEIYELLGEIYYKNNYYDQAIAYWKKSNSLNKSYLDKRKRLANFYLNRKDFDNAIQEYKILLSLTDNNDNNLKYNMAICYKATGNMEYAVTLLKNILETSPENNSARKLLSECLIAKGNDIEAISNYKLLISNDPQNFKAISALGDIYMTNNYVKEALELYSNALQIAPNSPDILLKYAIALKHVGKKDQAIQYFKKILYISPKSVHAKSSINYLNELGVNLIEENKISKSKYEKLISTGIIYQEQGLFEKASNKYKEAIKYSPNEKEAYYKLAEVLRQQGNKQEADKVYQIYLDKATNED